MTIIGPSSTSSFYMTAADQMGSLQSQLDALNNSISSGSRFSAASQDPIAAAQMRALQLQDSQGVVSTANANKATANLQLADSTLSQMVNDITRAKQLATQAATGTLNDTERTAIGDEMAQIQKDLIGLANSRDANGNALFGGGVAGNAYNVDAQGTVSYTGAVSSPSLDIGNGQSVQTGVTGPEVLDMTDAAGNSTDLLTVVGNLATALKAGGSTAQTAASDALTSLSNGLDAVNTAQTTVGTRESWISLVTQNQTAAATARATQESQIGDTDVSGAAIKLQQLTTALQASQASFVRLSGLSLFDVIGN